MGRKVLCCRKVDNLGNVWPQHTLFTLLSGLIFSKWTRCKTSLALFSFASIFLLRYFLNWPADVIPVSSVGVSDVDHYK